MSSPQLRAVVIGAGLAGDGHCRALQHNGVEVVAICARQLEVVREVADRLGVPIAPDNWHQTLPDVRPDVVGLATPAWLRAEPIELACELGCHLYSDKPLAATAPEARRLYECAAGRASGTPTRRPTATTPASSTSPSSSRQGLSGDCSTSSARCAGTCRRCTPGPGVTSSRAAAHLAATCPMTFHDGWCYQEAIDAIRAGDGWHELPT